MQIIIRMIKTKSTEWFINIVCIGKVKNILIIFVGKYEGMKKFDSCKCRNHIGRLFPVYVMKAYGEWR